jgi:hypothetical protein
MSREEIIGLVTRINALRSEVSRLNGLQKELKSLEAQLDGIADAPPIPQEGDSASLEDRVVAVVDSEPERDWVTEDITAKLDAKVESVRAALSKSVGVGRIVRVRRGIFQSKLRQTSEPLLEGDTHRAA